MTIPRLVVGNDDLVPLPVPPPPIPRPSRRSRALAADDDPPGNDDPAANPLRSCYAAADDPSRCDLAVIPLRSASPLKIPSPCYSGTLFLCFSS
ncbi:hypothetical protein KSP39_PZI001314 [Platanthera zijinensis]|uniref:Uncharacterized protein n=1 Tax=Platanthera zijinensis TaxID=2320716 RepID=A0AAP0GFN3_9ASPA